MANKYFQKGKINQNADATSSSKYEFSTETDPKSAMGAAGNTSKKQNANKQQ